MSIRDEKELPTQRAYCKYCNAETSKPVAYVNFNGKEGIVLECEKCHSRYIMYTSAYNQRYVGLNTKFGRMAATHRRNNGAYIHQTREIKDRYDRYSKQRREKLDNELSKTFNMSKDELYAMRERHAKEMQRVHKKMQREQADFRNKMEEERIQRESENRQELIKQGILVYNKQARALVDTRTGQIVKL